MKIDGLDHPKTIDLADELGICVPQAIGHLELMWRFVGQKTPRGNIGRWSDAVIANAAQWQGKGADFVGALVKVGYLDEHPDHRLVVHDWHEHMPRWVKAKLGREKKSVVGAQNNGDCNEDDSQDYSSDCSGDCSQDCSGDCSGDCDSTSASEVKGSVVKGSEGKGGKAARATSLPKNFAITPELEEWARKKGFSHLDDHLEYFRGYALAHGKTYKNWVQAFQNCVRDDWGDVREGRRSTPAGKEADYWLRGAV